MTSSPELPKSGWRKLRWLLAIVLILLGIVAPLLFSVEVCSDELAQAGNVAVVEVCRPYKVMDPIVLFGIALILFLIWPDLSEMGLLGVTFKRKVEEGQKRTEEAIRNLSQVVAMSVRQSVNVFPPWSDGDFTAAQISAIARVLQDDRPPLEDDEGGPTDGPPEGEPPPDDGEGPPADGPAGGGVGTAEDDMLAEDTNTDEGNRRARKPKFVRGATAAAFLSQWGIIEGVIEWQEKWVRSFGPGSQLALVTPTEPDLFQETLLDIELHSLDEILTASTAVDFVLRHNAGTLTAARSARNLLVHSTGLLKPEVLDALTRELFEIEIQIKHYISRDANASAV